MYYISCIAMLFLISCGSSDLSERKFQFNYKVNIESSNGKKLEVWIPVPKSNEVQSVDNLNIDTGGLKYTIENESVHGNKYLYINESNGTNSPTTISMTFDVNRKEHKNVNYKDVNPENYLGSYSTVPVGGVFQSVIEKNKLSKDNVRGIYDYVYQGMNYGKPKSEDNVYYNSPWLEPEGKYGMMKVGRDVVLDLYKQSKKKGGNYTFGKGNSMYACYIGVGNCTDYHSYFMSLDRTLNIPARFHMGFSIPMGEEGPVGGYHCWSDYYVEGEGWYPVDISEADKDPSKKDYFFGTVSSNRFEMAVGRDFVLKGHESNPVNIFIYPLMEIDNQKSNSFEKSFSYKNL